MKNKNKNIIILFIAFLVISIILFADMESDRVSIGKAISMEIFVTINMLVFILYPLSVSLSPANYKKTFWKLFAIRAVVLLFLDLYIPFYTAVADFFLVYFGIITFGPISSIISKSKSIGTTQPSTVGVAQNTPQNQPSTAGVAQNTQQPQNKPSAVTVATNTPQSQVKGIELKCAKCNTPLKITYKHCPNCGEEFDGNNVVVSENENGTVQIPAKTVVKPSNFDKMYSLSEDKMLESAITKEITKASIEKSSRLIPSDVLKRKKILNIIFSVLVFVFVTIIFFHFPIYTYIFGVIILLIFFKATRSYNLVKYLKKQVKARPSEKISNIVMNAKNTFIIDDSKRVFAISFVLAIVLPLIIFSSPRIIYEKVDNGYAVRYYIFGLTNFKTATIPETYKNEKVVTLRGNTFSNMLLLEKVSLPDSITEIRGQAFKECTSLVEVNMPNNLEYLGGGAFYNAKSIRRVELPDTLTYLGGESFYGASSLEYVKLSNSLTEIRGDSFEYCTSLSSITIPDNITRIGGHAFYGDSSLSEVLISPNSRLGEIGSSAFRQCTNLYNIIVPYETYVNERAFKESPTVINRYQY